MFSLECLYDFHPDLFRQLTDDERQVLSKTFLYDYDDYHDDDSAYPKSFRHYFDDNIRDNAKLQAAATSALSHLYAIGGMGEFKLSDIELTAP